jgi:hypothetical protein
MLNKFTAEKKFDIFFINKTSALEREHPALQNMKFLFSIFVSNFCPSGSGSTFLVEPGSNPDMDPKRYIKSSLF